MSFLTQFDLPWAPWVGQLTWLDTTASPPTRSTEAHCQVDILVETHHTVRYMVSGRHREHHYRC